MANRYLDKAVYIRETTNGKTKWVKIPGVTIQNGWHRTRVFIHKETFTQEKKESWHNSIVFQNEERVK